MLIPVKRYKKNRGNFVFPSDITISSIDKSDFLPIRQLKNDLLKLNINCTIKNDLRNASIVLRRDKALTNKEQYLLNVNENQIEIVSGAKEGAYYAIQTLRDIITLEGDKLTCCRIEDSPDLNRRGVYHDVSRGKVPTVKTIKELVEQLAHWKINEFSLYIENTFMFKKHPDIGKDYSPFTPDDLLKIQEHCKKHHVNFIPSLASFGHMEKILMLPKYQKLGELPGFRDLPGGTTLSPVVPGSIKLVADMYREFVPLFESDDFNICGDEPWELGKGQSKDVVTQIGKGRLYLDFILKIHKICLKYNKRTNMWGDIVLEHPEIIPMIPKDIVLLNWDYEPGGKRISKTKKFKEAGLPFMCCPGTNAWRSHASRLNMSLNNVYSFAKVAVKYGAEGLLNTDWGDFGHRNTLGVSLCSFAHGAACAWNVKGVKNSEHVNNFTRIEFGDVSGSFADAIKEISKAEENIFLYNVLTESIYNEKILTEGFAVNPPEIDNVSIKDKDIYNRIKLLKSITISLESKRLNKFKKTVLDEYRLAGMMNLAALNRLLIARKVRSNKKIDKSELLEHKNELIKINKEFKKVWRLRNRPSRLKDNIIGFEKAVKEIEGIV